MLLIVLIALLLATIYLSTLHDKNYANPIFIVVAVFMAGCAVAAANMIRWSFVLSSETFFVIIAVLGAWIIGCSLGEKITFNIGSQTRLTFGFNRRSEKTDLLEASNPSDANIACATLLQLALVVYYVLYYIRAVGGISPMFFSILREKLEAGESAPFIIGHILLITRAIAMIFIYHCIKAIINRKIKDALKDLIPIMLYFGMEAFGTSRSPFVYIGGYAVVVYTLLFYKKNRRSVRAARKIRKTVVKIAIALIIAFISLGYLTGKTQYMGAIDMMSMYVGAPICNIQYYLENHQQFVSPFFGAYTQPLLGSIQKKLLHVSGTDATSLYYPFVKYDNTLGRTNIYTAIVKPLIDFGLGGTILFYFLCGCFIGAFYKRVLRRDCSMFSFIMFGYCCMPLFLFGLEYQIGNYWLATRTLYVIIYTFIFCRLFRGGIIKR